MVVHNAPTYLEDVQCEEEKNIAPYFLPPHVASLLQPIDQDVIASFKRRYKHKFLSEMLSTMNDQEGGLIATLKNINLKEVIYM